MKKLKFEAGKKVNFNQKKPKINTFEEDLWKSNWKHKLLLKTGQKRKS